MLRPGGERPASPAQQRLHADTDVKDGADDFRAGAGGVLVAARGTPPGGARRVAATGILHGEFAYSSESKSTQPSVVRGPRRGEDRQTPGASSRRIVIWH